MPIDKPRGTKASVLRHGSFHVLQKTCIAGHAAACARQPSIEVEKVHVAGPCLVCPASSVANLTSLLMIQGCLLQRSEWLRARALQALAGRDGGLCHCLLIRWICAMTALFNVSLFVQHAVRLCEVVSHCRGFCTCDTWGMGWE